MGDKSRKITRGNGVNDEFMLIAGHELKTPITTIKLMAHSLIIEAKKRGEKDFEVLGRRIDDQTKRVGKIIEDMLDYSKIQSKMIELSRERVDINELVVGVVRDIENFAGDRNISIVGNLSRPIEIDKYRIARVLTNLLINAVKYSGEKSKITISISKKRNLVTIGVCDEGVGISQADAMDIFHKFYRAKNTKQMTAGMGLGLYISKQIVELHQGRIWIESEVGKGSTFYFSLPIIRQEV